MELMAPPPCESAASQYRVGLIRFESGRVLVFWVLEPDDGSLPVRFLEGWSPAMAPGHSTVMRLLPHPPSSGHDPKILGLQSSHGSPCRRDCQHYGYLSGCVW